MILSENQQRIENAIDNLLFDERRTLQRIDVETLVDAYRRACIERDELRAQLAAAQAKIDAVPAEEMYFYMRHSCGWRIGTPEKVERYTQCERSIDRWLVAQPECDAWIKRVQP